MVEGYCVHCKSKQEIENEIESQTSRGVPMIKGKCKICKTNMCKIGSKIFKIK